MSSRTGILVVDDTIASLHLITETLSSEGYSVRPAISGEKALRAIEQELPELILLDIQMPGINGFEVCKQLQNNELTKSIPILFLSASTDTDERVMGLELGAVDFIPKPFQKQELLARVKTHLELSRLRVSLEEQVLIQTTELRAEKERLSVTLRSIGDGVITTDIHGHIMIMNTIAEQLTGWSQADAIGKPLEDVFVILNQENRKVHENPVKKVLATNSIVELANHTILIAKDGTERPIGDSGAPITNANGIIIGVVLVFRNMSEHYKTQEALQRIDKLDALGILAGGIAHDFNNLLSGIFGYIELAMLYAPEKSETGEMLENALSVFERAKNLTMQLLTFSKGGSPIKKTGDIAKTIRQNVDFILSGTNIGCRYNFPDNLWSCNFDINQIGQVIDNVTINAIQAMPNGGHLTISATNFNNIEGKIPGLNSDSYIETTIIDSGMGMPAEIIKRIFDPFYTTKPTGNGLGLATCYSIIKKHDGLIIVSSEIGIGTTFKIYLPASFSEIETHTNLETITHHGSGRILIMDDEEFMRNLLENMLVQVGFSVSLATNGEDALIQSQNSINSGEIFSCILLDLTIPGGLGGKEIIDSLRQIYPAIPIIAISGYSENPIMAFPTQYGFTDSLEKPFRKNQFIDIVNRHICKD